MPSAARGQGGSEFTGAAEQLLKGVLAGLAGSTDAKLREVVFAVLADGLRPPR